MMKEMANIEKWHEIARTIAAAGGKTTLPYFRSNHLIVEKKSDNTPVTEADKKAEQHIRTMLQSHFPQHNIIGEEYGGTDQASGYTWVIDPIDGTKSFIRGVPLYTTLLALLKDMKPIIGVIYAPATGEMASAALSYGAWNEDGNQITVSQTKKLSQALALTTDPNTLFQSQSDLCSLLLSSTMSLQTWADAYGYLLVARGDADIMIDPIMSLWDIAPLSVIIREAHGVFSDFHGDTTHIGNSAIAAATHELQKIVLSRCK